MARNKYYVILGILAMAVVFTQGAFAQIKKEDKSGQIPILKEYSKKGENNKAINLAQEILRVDPSNIAALNILTGVYINMDNLPAAEETVKKALAIEPDDPVACQLLVRLYRIKAAKNPSVATNNLNLAMEQLQKGLVSNPDDIMLLAEEAQIYSARGNKPKAQQIITRAIAISPENNYLKMLKEKIDASQRIEQKETSK